jgi:drug/metabolite transporter (DMT)-like permease
MSTTPTMRHTKKVSRTDYILLVTLAALYGAIPIFLRETEIFGGSLVQSWLRCTLAFLLLFFLPMTELPPLGWRDRGFIVARIIIGWILGLWTFVEACQHTSIARAALFASIPSTPFWGIIVLGERVTFLIISRWALTIVGVILLQGTGSVASESGFIGDVLALTCGLCISFSSCLAKLQKVKLPTLSLTRYMLGITSGILGLMCLRDGSLLRLSEVGCSFPWIMISLSGVQLALTSCLGLYLQQRVPLTMYGNVLALESVFAMFLGWIIFHETMNQSGLYGAACVVVACLEFGWLQDVTQNLFRGCRKDFVSYRKRYEQRYRIKRN